jgi:hypothetical protein
MKFSFIEVALLLLITFLCFFVYQQNEKIESLYDTLDIQHEAILKQKLLIDLQSNQIHSMEYRKTYQNRPNFL